MGGEAREEGEIHIIQCRNRTFKRGGEKCKEHRKSRGKDGRLNREMLKSRGEVEGRKHMERLLHSYCLATDRRRGYQTLSASKCKF